MFESIGTALGMLVIYFINEWRKVRNKKKEELQKIKNAVDENSLIYPILWKALAKYNANRVFITQFHNGGKYYSAKHIQRMTISHEVTDDMTHSIMNSFTDVVISESIHTIMLKLRTDIVYKEDDIQDTKDQELEMGMKVYKLKSIYVLPLRNKEGYPIGLLNFNFNKINGLTDFEIAEIEYIKNEIENILNN